MHVVDRPSKYSREHLLKLFKYSLGEDIANAVTHIVGSFFAVYAIINLSWVAGRYGNWLDSVAFIFYGLTILFMFTMSSLYHSMINHTARTVFKTLDHIAIYWLILGSYTPYVFSLIKTWDAYIIYGFLFALSILGGVFKSFLAGRFKIISTLVYVIMGWAIVWILPDLINKLNIVGLWYLIAGGLCYTLGAMLYAFGKFKYSHMVWHVFVFFGVLFQFISINFYILQYR
ncbi:MAG: hemolysin III family protein [Burkholderiales bacterium]|nr:hemolysin III family protein [Burkholderiales bacterium]